MPITTIVDNNITYTLDSFSTILNTKTRNVQASFSGTSPYKISEFNRILLNQLNSFLNQSNTYRQYSIIPHSEYFVFNYNVTIADVLVSKIIDINFFDLVLSTIVILTQDIYRYRICNVTIKKTDNSLVAKFSMTRNYQTNNITFNLTGNTNVFSYAMRTSFITSIVQATENRDLPYTTIDDQSSTFISKYKANISIVNYKI